MVYKRTWPELVDTGDYQRLATRTLFKPLISTTTTGVHPLRACSDGGD